MSKRAEEFANKAYPNYSPDGKTQVDMSAYRFACAKGYEQAEKDTIAKIRKQVKRWMPDNPEGDEYTSGERVAFRSVLNLLKEMEEEE